MKKKLNIDIVRFIVSIFVITIHTFPLAQWSETIDYAFTRVLFRLCVPFFLMITGYFLIDGALEDKKKLVKQTKKIVILYAISTIIYLPIMVYNGYFENFSLWLFLRELFVDGLYYHLWYFPASIVGLWLLYFALKKFQLKTILIACMGLYLVGLLGDSYYGFFVNNSVFKGFFDFVFTLSFYTRNGLFYAPMFLSIGYFVKKKKNVDVKKSAILGLVFTGAMMVEGMFLYRLGVPRHTSMYLFLVPASRYIFEALMGTEPRSNVFFRNVSSWVYIIHPFFIVAVHFFSNIVHMEFLFQNNFINFTLVTISSCVFSVGVAFFYEKAREKSRLKARMK